MKDWAWDTHWSRFFPRPMTEEMSRAYDKTLAGAEEARIRAVTQLKQELRRTAVELAYWAFPASMLRRFGL